MDNKAPDAFRTISEVADELDLPQHVLRFWESRFRDIKPMKRGGGRRYYRPEDISLLRGIRHLLYGEGYTIRGVQRILREEGVGFVQAVWEEGSPQPPHGGENAARDNDDIADEAIDDEAETGLTDEPRGLRGRLSNLLGRDLGDRNDINDGRRDPPLHSAPMPRIDPGDRVSPTVYVEDDEPESPRIAPEPRAIEPRAVEPPSVVSAAPAFAAIPDDKMTKLRDVLQELTECRKLIDGAMTRGGDTVS